ncbi:MAG: hypothetical protein HN553_07715, partial [Opitutae bacterium]|nr:hypothetical protein [Opitutae bacterium]
MFYTVLHGNLAKHSLIIKSDGSLHTFGKNSPGQTPFQRVTPTQILASGVSQITAGINHSLILKTDGSLLAFGSNTSGQLGDGTTTDRSTPTQILASGVSQIAAGETHSLILKADGSLHTFGKNNYGQLGDGTTTDRSTPTQILASGVSQIAAGFAHSLILKTDGSLHTFGKNNNGQLGDGTTTDRSTPTQILASGVSRIAAGENHSLIIKSDGSLHAFGWNGKGQLGNGTTNQRNTPTQILTSGVAQIAAGLYHSLILKSDGSLYTFGENIYGQMGDGTTANKNTPTQILSSGVAQITAGRHHSLILKSNGSLHAFGRNNYGQLGDGTTTDRNTPTQILASGVARLSEQPLPQNDFIPIYPLNSSQLTTLVDSSSIVAGNFKIVEELNSSNELELRIRPVYQSNGNWLDAGANQFYRTNSSYPTLSSVLSYISSNNINAVNAPSGDTISITAPTSGSTVTSNNDNLHVYISYQSNGGGYQTPTWAYRIDSGFPAYGSPHGGTQVVGTTNRNDIFNGLSYGQRQVNVALLDQSGNLHNPPITQTISVNYQSTTGGYQTPTGDTIAITSPGNGSVVTPNNDNLSVNITY